MYSVYSVYKVYTNMLFKSIYPHIGYATYFSFPSIEPCKKSVSRKNTSCILVLLCLQSLQSFQQGNTVRAYHWVAYLRLADKYLGPLANRLRAIYQPMIRTPNPFFSPRPRPLACF